MKLITISREFGSGGRELGKRLADEMGFSYFDKEIIGKIAENLKLNEQYIESVLDRGFTVNYPYTFHHSFSTQMNALNPAPSILAEQHKIIRSLAEKGDCIIVGRGAEVILHERIPYSVFVYADMAAKIMRCRQRADDDENLSDRELERRIKQIDKARASYHSLISRTQWGDRQAYQLCVNTTGFEIADLVAPIAALAEKFFERTPK